MSNVSRTVLGVLEVAALVVLGLLVWKSSVLQRQLSEALSRQSQVLSVGQRMEQVPIIDLNGRSRQLDLRSSRNMVVVVDPSCASCGVVLSRLGSVPGVYVMSIGAPSAAKALAEKYDLVDNTFVIRPPLPDALDRGFRTFPQIVIVERGRVMRTCATLSECGVGTSTSSPAS